MISRILLFFTALTPFTVFGQDYSVKGRVADTVSAITLHNSSVSVLNAKDSTLVRFTRAAAGGEFTITKLSPGKYILLVTYPDYADYVENFSLDNATPVRDFGKIGMNLRERVLQEVMIKGSVASIKIKGDTTEFDPRAYATLPNAKVEDLLKQLPGIQIDKDGKITAQGQAVKKVLVDGEEFFGDDPTLVTKNLRADMVDKVQLFDKKSDQAAFTGVDDGQEAKTINIKLKDDAKKGYFGKAEGGKSADDFYQGQLMYNSFRAKRKFSAFGTTANTGQTGLSWEDNDKYSGSSNVEFVDGGFYMDSGDDYSGGRYWGEGIPSSRTAGAHFDTKWKEDKFSLAGNYRLNSLEVNAQKNTLNQNTLPSGVIATNSDKFSNTKSFRQKVDMMLEVKLDTSSNLKITASASLSDNESKVQLGSLGLRQGGARINASDRTTTNDNTGEQYNFSAFYSRKLKKKGRTVSLNVAQSINNSDSEGLLYSVNDFYNTSGVLDSVQTVNQQKNTELRGSVLNVNATYTEPLSASWSLVFNAGYTLNQSTSDRRSYNASAPGVYNLLDKLYSNDFELEQGSTQGGAVFNYRKNKTIMSFGTRATNVTFDQLDRMNSVRYARHFVNWLPQASWQYRFTNQKSLRLNYNGSTNQPGIAQIQPVRVNDDPLNITLGNADLNPSFRNRISFNYNSYKVISDRSIYLNGSVNFTNQAIISKRITDLSGKSTIQSINLEGRTPFGYNVYGWYNRKVKALGVSIGLDFDLGSNISYGFVNNGLNKNTSSNYNTRFSLSKNVAKKYYLNASFGPTFTTLQSSLQPEANTNGTGYDGWAGGDLNLPGKLLIQFSMQYRRLPKTAAFNDDFDQVLSNVTFSKKFLKSEGLRLSLSGNDLFNQNSGFDRNVSGMMITQDRYNTIKRFFLFSLTYDFSKMGGKPAQKEEK